MEVERQQFQQEKQQRKSLPDNRTDEEMLGVNGSFALAELKSARNSGMKFFWNRDYKLSTVVIKIGGTTIGGKKGLKKHEGFINAGEKIIEYLERYDQVICVCSAYNKTTDTLISSAANLTHLPDKKSLDLLLSTGEQESVALLAIYLKSKSIDCTTLTGWQCGIITNSNFGSASIESIDRRYLTSYMQDHRIILVTGFQGVNNTGELTTLGRGGSDTTAIALAIASRADKCEIITDVDGLYTCNPNIYDSAKLIKDADFDFVLEMASSGADVIDCRAIDLAKRRNCSFSIKNWKNHFDMETIVSDDYFYQKFAITTNANCTVLNISNISNNPGLIHEIFQIIEGYLVRIGSVQQSFSNRGFADVSILFWDADIQILEDIKVKISKSMNGVHCSTHDKISSISLISRAIENKEGVLLKCLMLFRESHIEVLGFNTSKMRITFLIKEDDIRSATIVLHDEYVS